MNKAMYPGALINHIYGSNRFCYGIKRESSGKRLLVYQDLLKTSDEVKDPLWKEILPLYRSMNKEQQVAFLQFLRVIQVNTVSHILGILDVLLI